MSAEVLIIGGGLAGCTAALSARARGARVTLYAGPPGAIAGWSGRLDAFGPWADPRPDDLPFFGPAPERAAPAPARVARAERLAALLQRRPDHPYARLGLDAVSLEEGLRAALALFGPGCPLIFGPPSAYASEVGTLTLGDGAASSVAAVGGPEPSEAGAQGSAPSASGALRLCAPILWLDVPGAGGPSGEGAARLLEAQAGLDEGGVRAVSVEIPGVEAWGAPAALARRLDQGVDGAEGESICEAVRAACAGGPEGGLILAPPVWGQRFEVAATWMARLKEATGREVGEALAVGSPIFGLRLWRWLRGALEAQGVEVIAGRARGLRLGIEGGRATSALVEREGGERVFEGLERVVLATGGLMGGGVSAEAPLRESLLGLPLSLGSRSIDGADLDPTALLPRRPWSGGPLATLGVVIDGAGRPCVDGGPLAQNVFAAGRLVAGTSPTLDGCAQGVDLITGLRAGGVG